MRRSLTRFALPLGVSLAILAVSSPALAHVTITASDATPGGSDVEITIRVPNEIPPARVVLVAVQFPLDTPIADVLVQPTAGWSFTAKTAKLAKPIVTDDGEVTEAVSEIDWRATGAGIGVGEFGAFTVIAGQLPQAKSLTFKAIQTYSNGTKVSWIEVPAPGSSADAAHPAPVLILSPAPSATLAARTGGTDNTLGVAALAVAVLGAGLAVAAYQRSRNRT
jgi:uncharacterized protein YcnI